MRKVVSRLYIHFRLTPLWSDGGYSKILVLPRPRLYHHMMYCAAQKSGISVLFVLSGDHRELTKIVPYQIRSCSLILIFTVVSFQIIWASIFKSENHYKNIYSWTICWHTATLLQPCYHVIWPIYITRV